jgi:flagellar hook-associated protein 2
VANSTTDFVTSLGAGSGINIKELSQALVDAEKIPRESLIQGKLDKSTAKISGLGVVKAVLERFRTSFKALDSTADFNAYTTSNSNSSALKLTTSSLAKRGTHSIAVNAMAKAAREQSSGFSSTAAELNGGEAFAIQISTREQQKLTFTAASVAGTLTISGINVSVAAGDSAATVAAKAKEALQAGGSSFVSSNSGREISAKSDGTLTVTYELGEGDVAASALEVSSVGSSDVTATFATVRNGVQELSIGSAEATPLGVVSAINSSTSTLGITAQLINDGSGGATPFKILLTGDTGVNNQFSVSSTSSIPETQRVSFGTAQSTGAFTVAGVSVAVSAGESPTIISARVKIALEADVFITNSAGRSISQSSDGSLLITYTRSDGDASFPTFGSLSGVVEATVAEQQSYSANSTNSTMTFSSVQSASNSLLVVDGMSVERATNLIGDVISGVTMELLSTASAAAAANITIARDTSAVKATLTELITAYNEGVSDFAILTGTPNEDDPEDTYSGSLNGESSVRSIQFKLRDMLINNSSTPSTNLSALRDIGISLDRNGSLQIDDTKLDSALNTKFDEVITLFGGNAAVADSSRGIAGDAIKKLDSMLSTTGLVKRQETSANRNVTKYKEDLTKLEARMEVLLERYTRQFAIMDALVGQLNAQRESLKGSFDALMSSYSK